MYVREEVVQEARGGGARLEPHARRELRDEVVRGHDVDVPVEALEHEQLPALQMAFISCVQGGIERETNEQRRDVDGAVSVVGERARAHLPRRLALPREPQRHAAHRLQLVPAADEATSRDCSPLRTH